MPKVFLTDLHAYNSGSLHGKWVDATDADVMHEAFKEILASSPYPGGEEWFITDYDEFEGYSVGEYEPLEQVAKVAAAIEEHGAAVALWLAHDAENIDKLDQFEDHYVGEVDSEEDYERERWRETTLEVFKDLLRQADERIYDSVYKNPVSRMFEESIEDYIDVDRASNGIAQDVTFLVGSDGTTYAFRDEP